MCHALGEVLPDTADKYFIYLYFLSDKFQLLRLKVIKVCNYAEILILQAYREKHNSLSTSISLQFKSSEALDWVKFSFQNTRYYCTGYELSFHNLLPSRNSQLSTSMISEDPESPTSLYRHTHILTPSHTLTGWYISLHSMYKYSQYTVYWTQA